MSGRDRGVVAEQKSIRNLFTLTLLFTKQLFCVFFGFFFFKAAELRAYLKSKGAEISEENAEGGLHVDLAQIIEVCDVCLKEDDKGLHLLSLVGLAKHNCHQCFQTVTAGSMLQGLHVNTWVIIKLEVRISIIAV